MMEPPVDRPVPEPDRIVEAESARRGRLSGRLTINEAEALRDVLVGWLAEGRDLRLETRDLEAVDVAGLQLLIAVRRSAERAGKAVRLASAPEGALLAALVAAGFRPADDGGQPDANQDGFWWGRS